jgi:hypothetical protein
MNLLKCYVGNLKKPSIKEKKSIRNCSLKSGRSKEKTNKKLTGMSKFIEVYML